VHGAKGVEIEGAKAGWASASQRHRKPKFARYAFTTSPIAPPPYMFSRQEFLECLPDIRVAWLRGVKSDIPPGRTAIGSEPWLLLRGHQCIPPLIGLGQLAGALPTSEDRVLKPAAGRRGIALVGGDAGPNQENTIGLRWCNRPCKPKAGIGAPLGPTAEATIPGTRRSTCAARRDWCSVLPASPGRSWLAGRPATATIAPIRRRCRFFALVGG
jgi:hypothetical protein